MSLYTKLRNLIESGDIDTITVDIFDTVLLRRVWPEGIQFLEVARRSVSLFQTHINPSITAYEVYSYREYVRRELLSAKADEVRQESLRASIGGSAVLDQPIDVDVSLEEWLRELVRFLTIKYGGEAADISDAFVKQLVALELVCEEEYTSPNPRVVTTLRRIRHNFPQVKVFFLSDMYLDHVQIGQLLEAHDVADLFDAGLTSTEVQRAKHSSRLFHYIHDRGSFDGFDLYRNVHFGDSPHADVTMATIAGSYALHYHHIRLRRLRTFVGRAKLWWIRRRARDAAARAFERELERSNGHESPSRVLRDLGIIFVQPLAAHLFHIAHKAALTNARYLLVSSEASVFDSIGKRLFGDYFNRLEVAPTLNRKQVLKALAWAIVRKQRPEHMTSLIQIVRYGEFSKDWRAEIYQFLLGREYPVSPMLLNHQKDDEFAEGLYIAIAASKPRDVRHLKNAYDRVKSVLPKDGETLVICDVGWGATLQVLLNEFAALHGITAPIEGSYLGAHPPTRFATTAPYFEGYLMPNVVAEPWRRLWNPIIWEYMYTNKPQFLEEDPMRLKHIHSGLERGYDAFRHIPLSPTEAWEAVIAPQIQRLLSNPTRIEVQAIGSIRFDWGFVDPRPLQLVNLSVDRWQLRRRLIFKPKTTLQSMLTPAWTAGYITYYGLIGLRPLLRIVGRFKRKQYL